MKNRNYWEQRRDKAEERVNDWYSKFDDALSWYLVCNKQKSYVTLTSVYGKYGSDYPENEIANSLEAEKVKVYEEDEETPRKKHDCTRRAIARIRRIEEQLAKWNNAYCLLDFAVDCWDEASGIPDDIYNELVAIFGNSVPR